MLIKHANTKITRVEDASQALSTIGAMNQFRTLVAEVKRIAPKSSDFTYFVCRAIHAMEYANFDETTGEFTGDGHLDENGRWASASGLQPYTNANGDAFPEKELLQSYGTFVGRGLFVNHASDDAEKIRGIILDAAWDPKTKGVDILVALDKIQYPELARQIEAGYSNDVSMGAQVQYSTCSDCGNKAVTEADYCNHIKASKGLTTAAGAKTYEVNHGLNFIEISVVANGADPQAKIKHIIASLNKLQQQRQSHPELEVIASKAGLSDLETKVAELTKQLQALAEYKTACEMCGATIVPADLKNQKCSECGLRLTTDYWPDKKSFSETNTTEQRKIGESEESRAIMAEYSNLSKQMSTIQEQLSNLENKFVGGLKMNKAELQARKNRRLAYMQGTEEPTKYPVEDYTTVRDTQDKQMVGQGMESGDTGMHPGSGSGSDEQRKKELLRARSERRKVAYFQGTEEPKTYPSENYTTVRDTQDKQMIGQGMESGDTGMHPGYSMSDEELKKKLLRAKLRCRFVEADNRKDSAWTVYAGDEPILETTVDELYGNDLDEPNEDNPAVTNWAWASSREYGINLIKGIKQLGFNSVVASIKGSTVTAQALPQPQEGEDDQNLDININVGGDEGGEETSLSTDDNVEEIPEESGDEAEHEAIISALDAIESSIQEIRSITDKEGLGTELDELEDTGLETGEEELASAGDELAELDKELEEASKTGEMPRVSALKAVIREALSDAGKSIVAVNTLVAKKKKKKDEEEEAKKGKGKKDKKDEKEDSKGKKDKKENPFAKKDKKENPFAKKDMKKKASAEDIESMSTLEKEAWLMQRKADRRTLAAEVSKLYDVTPGDSAEKLAHPKGGNSSAVSGHEVKTESGVQQVSLDVARKGPTGQIKAKLDERRQRRLAAVAKAKKVVAEGDPAEKSFYAELAKPGDQETKNFYQELVTDFDKSKKNASTDETKEKVKRAYAVALRQQQLKQIAGSTEALESQVDRLVSMDEGSFHAFTEAVNNTAIPQKAEASTGSQKTVTAGAIQVGQVEPEPEIDSALNKLPWS